MTDAELLLRACRVTRDDDTVRLALADELTATGFDSAADFIRNEIHWFRSGKPTRTPRGKAVHGTGGYVDWLESLFPDDLVVHNHGTQFAVFPKEVGVDRRRTVINTERGLPLDLVATAPHFMERAGLLFRFPIREVLLSDRRPNRGGSHYPDNYVWGRASWPQKFNTWEEEPAQVPAPLFDLLPVESRVMGMRLGHYPSRKQAQIALSLAAHAYGESFVRDEESPREP